MASIQDGLSRITWTTETFAIADSWDDKRQRFVGLRANCNVVLDADSTALLVKPEAALRQLDAERPSSTSPGAVAAKSSETQTAPGSEEFGSQKPAQPAKPTRFYGSVKLDPSRLNRDAAQVSAEVIQHLTSLLNAEVEVTLDIQAKVEGESPTTLLEPSQKIARR